MAKEKLPSFVSPAGIAIYPWITKADTKFNPGGDYRCKLRMPSKVAQGLIDKLEPLRQAALAEHKKAKKKNPKEGNVPWSTVLDDDGNETDEIEFNFKSKATITTKDGKTLTKKINCFDSKGKPMPEGIDIWGGSKLKVAFQAVPYDVAASGVGLSLRMTAVQVIDLVQGSGGNSGSSYGFGEEEGYVAEEATSGNTFSEEASDAEDAEEDF